MTKDDNRKKGTPPEIRREDLVNFLKYRTNDTNSIPDTLGAIRDLVILLRSSSDESYSEPPDLICLQRHEIFFKSETNKMVLRIIKFGLTGGAIALISALSYLYLKLEGSIRILYEDRKILSLIGAEHGWKIDEKVPGYKTPFEISLENQHNNTKTNIKDTPIDSIKKSETKRTEERPGKKPLDGGPHGTKAN